MSTAPRPTSRTKNPPPPGAPAAGAPGVPAFRSPFVRAPEGANSLLNVAIFAACAPLTAGMFFFGWRAGVVALICVTACVAVERLCVRVSRTPTPHGTRHSCLTGLLLALTLPAFAPWYVPLVASVFAVLVGKVAFGGVGHFLWQPALVGRLAVAVIFPNMVNPDQWPVLAESHMLHGDVTISRPAENYHTWFGTPAPDRADAFRLTPPWTVLSDATSQDPTLSGIAYAPNPDDVPSARPTFIASLPAMEDLLMGARPGGIGETSALIIVLAGLYLMYRHCVRWQLPLAFIVSAAVVAALVPVKLAGAGDSVINVPWPLLSEGLDVGFAYVSYQLLGGELLLAAFFLATEMTSRPLSRGGQLLFGAGCGALAMVLRLVVHAPIPCYMAVLAMNTLTPLIDSAWRPRVLGAPRWRWLRKKP